MRDDVYVRITKRICEIAGEFRSRPEQVQNPRDLELVAAILEKLVTCSDWQRATKSTTPKWLRELAYDTPEIFIP